MDNHSSNTRPLEDNASDEDDRSIVSTSWIFRNDTNTPDYNWVYYREFRHLCEIFDDSEAEDTVLPDDGTEFTARYDDDNNEAGVEDEEEVNGNANDACDSEDEENGNSEPVLGKRKASDL